MLKKSNKGAIVMSGIAMLSGILTSLFWWLLFNDFDINLVEGGPPSPLDGVIIITFLGLVSVVIVILLGAYFIRNWNESYFGKQGAIRWIIFGMLYGSMTQVKRLIPEGTVDYGFRSFLLEEVSSFVLNIIFIYLSHLVAFKLLKQRRNSL